MLKEDFWISIVGTQKYDDDIGKIKLDTVGTYIKKNGARFITYKEYDDDNPSISHTSVLKIEDNKSVTMMKSGSQTRLILEKGKRHTCLYDTGYGHFHMGVFTSQLKNELTDIGGKLKVNYTLDIDANLSSRNELCIEVKSNNDNLGGHENVTEDFGS